MDTPLLALRGLFGDKAHMVQYLPLGLKSTPRLDNSENNPFGNPSFQNVLFLNLPRSNSERDPAARRFLEQNLPKPSQPLGIDFHCFPNSVLRVKIVSAKLQT